MSAPDANGWMPIETAPKDGADVLGWSRTFRCPQTVSFDRKWGAWSSIPGRYGCNPTHWQPLPKPPVQS